MCILWKEQETLKSHGIFTLEEFVALPKDKVQSLNLIEEQKKAKSFVKSHKNQAVINELRKENEALKAKIASLEALLSAQKEDA